MPFFQMTPVMPDGWDPATDPSRVAAWPTAFVVEADSQDAALEVAHGHLTDADRFDVAPHDGLASPAVEPQLPPEPSDEPPPAPEATEPVPLPGIVTADDLPV